MYHSEDRRHVYQRIQNAKKLAIHLAEGYHNWMEECCQNTTDEVFWLVLNFIAVMNLYRLFRVTVHSGDAVIIEWIYREMLPPFNVTNKKHYFEIGLKQIEDLYNKISAKLLHLTRINRTVPLYTGFDSQGEPMLNWALDSLIETVQKYYHKMNFHTGKSNGWLKYSSHVMVMSKVRWIVMEEYSCLNNTDDRDKRFVDHQETNIKIGKGAKAVKGSSNPKCKRELCAVAEFILLSKMTREVLGWRYNNNAMWKVLDDCTVELISRSEKARAERMVKELQTEEEILLDQFTDTLFNNSEATVRVVEVDLTNDLNAENGNDNNDNEFTEMIDPVAIAAQYFL